MPLIPQAGEEQLPPGLAEILGGMGAPQGAPAEQGGSTDEKFKQALELLQQVLQEEPDDQDSQILATVVQNLYKILASRQQEQDKLMGGNPGQMRALRRAAP